MCVVCPTDCATTKSLSHSGIHCFYLSILIGFRCGLVHGEWLVFRCVVCPTYERCCWPSLRVSTSSLDEDRRHHDLLDAQLSSPQRRRTRRSAVPENGDFSPPRDPTARPRHHGNRLRSRVLLMPLSTGTVLAVAASAATSDDTSHPHRQQIIKHHHSFSG